MKLKNMKIEHKEGKGVQETRAAQAAFYSSLAEILESARFPLNGDYYSARQFETDVAHVHGLRDELLQENHLGLDVERIESRVERVTEKLLETVGTLHGGRI